MRPALGIGRGIRSRNKNKYIRRKKGIKIEINIRREKGVEIGLGLVTEVGRRRIDQYIQRY